MGPAEQGTFPGRKFVFFVYYCWAMETALTLILTLVRG